MLECDTLPTYVLVLAAVGAREENAYPYHEHMKENVISIDTRDLISVGM